MTAKNPTRRREDYLMYVVVAMVLGAVVVCHHLTSYALLAFLIVWGLVSWFLRHGQPTTSEPASGQASPKARGGMPSSGNIIRLALLLLAMILGWLVLVADQVLGYLSPLFSSAANQLLQLIQGEATSPQLFKDQAGDVAPLWEQIIGLASTGLIVLGLLWGVWLIRVLTPRYNALAITFGLVALAYPVSLGMRLSEAGRDIAGRSTEFTFVGTSLVLALVGEYFIGEPYQIGRGLLNKPVPIRLNKPVSIRRWIVVGSLLLCYVGGVILGNGPGNKYRLPGPYLVSADNRSIEAKGISAAKWTYQAFGPDNRFAADRINRLLLATYGRQHPVTQLGDTVEVSPLYFSLEFGNYQKELIRQGKIRYLLVDRRFALGLPGVGIYFETSEANANHHQTPIPLEALTKFDQLAGVSRLFDNGDIIIYDFSGHE
ncbi:MAG: hypothetical protein WCS37_15090 [Chloroflexota bacterium]